MYIADNIKFKHAFFGRQGGVSEGFYESLNFNIKSQDAPKNIAQNLEIVGKHYHLAAKNIVRLLQDHTNVAVFTREPSQYQVRADAVVTDQKDLVLGITTADCVPILFADHKHKIIGAAHGGWRGVLYGVVENTIEVMLQNGAKLENIAVATGPCLGKKNFEVKNDMRQQFIDNDKATQKFFQTKEEGIFLCDLEKIIKYRLEKTGINDISLSGIDTYSNAEEYFSYRRFCHRELIKNPSDFPIQLSTIVIK